MSYTIDVIRGKEKPASFLKLALYVSFFPQLVAGPIVKAGEFLPQLEEDRRITLPNIERGVQIFVFGLFKKVVIADHLSVFVDDVFETPMAFHSATIILAIISYSIQIYFDFSGYSDMAVGCAKCLGYDFNRNFNMPYIAKNMSEFWKRWHISLSS
jgi:alginate O-acetyltransferase complex protein AlgI